MATRHDLTLQEKVQLIFDNNEANGLSQHMGRLVKYLFRTLSIIVALIAIGIGYLKVNHVFRQKLFAILLNKFIDPNDTNIMDLRCKELFIHSNVEGKVLEIGSGTGINFPCLHNNTNIQSYIGIEPNVHMHQYFYDFIKQWKIPYEIRLSDSSATDMHEIESDSIDTVIMTLVLCSVPDPLPQKVLLEAYRVLKPGGKFIVFEHILANSETSPSIHRIQKVIEPVWAIIGDGCRFKPMTNYFDEMKNVYSKVEYELSVLPVPFLLVSDIVKGTLVK